MTCPIFDCTQPPTYPTPLLSTHIYTQPQEIHLLQAQAKSTSNYRGPIVTQGPMPDSMPPAAVDFPPPQFCLRI